MVWNTICNGKRTVPLRWCCDKIRFAKRKAGYVENHALIVIHAQCIETEKENICKENDGSLACWTLEVGLILFGCFCCIGIIWEDKFPHSLNNNN